MYRPTFASSSVLILILILNLNRFLSPPPSFLARRITNNPIHFLR
jgi:hypothetical protein